MRNAIILDTLIPEGTGAGGMRPVWNRQEQIPVGSFYEILRISHLFYLGSVLYNRKTTR